MMLILGYLYFFKINTDLLRSFLKLCTLVENTLQSRYSKKLSFNHLLNKCAIIDILTMSLLREKL